MEATYSYSPVIEAGVDARIRFLRRVYQHLAIALGAFIVIEFALFRLGFARVFGDFIATNSLAWLAVLGAFMVANTLVTPLMYKFDDPGSQYIGLFSIAGIQAVIFAPMFYYVFEYSDNGGATIAQAAAVSLVGFAALSVVAFTTRKSLSFLRPIVMWGGIAAIGLIVASALFGAHLGTFFSVAMVGWAGAAILYHTQKIYREYPEAAYVGAAAVLFGSLMTMFWYVLSIFMDR